MNVPKQSGSVAAVVHVALSLVLAVGAGGCDRGPPVVRVEGRVLLDGEPLEAADVGFTPLQDRGGLTAGGRTRPDGTFLLTSRGARVGAGALRGEYLVTVRKMRERPEGDGAYTPTARDFIVPPLYGDLANSPLRATVGSGKNSFEFSLRSTQ